MKPIAPKSSYRRHISWYTAPREPDESLLTPHAAAIVRVIRAFGRPCCRNEIVAGLERGPNRIRHTDQEEERIFSFHKKSLLAGRFIRVRKRYARRGWAPPEKNDVQVPGDPEPPPNAKKKGKTATMPPVPAPVTKVA
jgi:hypothetical protein